MDEYVYYWPNKKVYCYRDELIDFIDCYGHNYSCHLEVDFFNEIWNEDYQI